MIARVWKGLVPKAQSERYLDYLEATGVKDCRATGGNRGVWVLRRVGERHAEFLFISLWESLDVIRAFAGDDVEKAVYYPKDRDFLIEMTPRVEHFEVAVSPERRRQA